MLGCRGAVGRGVGGGVGNCLEVWGEISSLKVCGMWRSVVECMG